MTYIQLAGLFLVASAVLAAVAFAALPHARRRAHLLAILATAVGLVALTAVFDSLMIKAGLFSFDGDKLTGLAVGLAPVEDLVYALACALALPAVWVLLRRRRG